MLVVSLKFRSFPISISKKKFDRAAVVRPLGHCRVVGRSKQSRQARAHTFRLQCIVATRDRRFASRGTCTHGLRLGRGWQQRAARRSSPLLASLFSVALAIPYSSNHLSGTNVPWVKYRSRRRRRRQEAPATRIRLTSGSRRRSAGRTWRSFGAMPSLPSATR